MFAAEAPRSGELTDSLDTHAHAMATLDKSTFSGEGEPDYNTLLSDSFMADLWKDSHDLPLERNTTFDGQPTHAKAPTGGAAARGGAPNGHAAAQADAQPAFAGDAVIAGQAAHGALQQTGAVAAATASNAAAQGGAGAATPPFSAPDALASAGGAAFAAHTSGHLSADAHGYAAPEHAQTGGGTLAAPYSARDATPTIFTELPTAGHPLQQPAPPVPAGPVPVTSVAHGGGGAEGAVAPMHMARLGSGSAALPPAPLGAAAQPQRLDSGAVLRTESGAGAAAAAHADAMHAGATPSQDPRHSGAAADTVPGAAEDAAGGTGLAAADGGAAGEAPEAMGGDDAKPDPEDADRPDKKASVTTVQITREIYQDFKKHVDEQDQIRVQEWHAAQEGAGAGENGTPAAKAAKPPTKPTLGKAVAHACQLLMQHVNASEENESDVQAAFREFQTGRKAKAPSAVPRTGIRLPEEVVPTLARIFSIEKPLGESWGLRRFMVEFAVWSAMGRAAKVPTFVTAATLQELAEQAAEVAAEKRKVAAAAAAVAKSAAAAASEPQATAAPPAAAQPAVDAAAAVDGAGGADWLGSGGADMGWPVPTDMQLQAATAQQPAAQPDVYGGAGYAYATAQHAPTYGDLPQAAGAPAAELAFGGVAGAGAAAHGSGAPFAQVHAGATDTGNAAWGAQAASLPYCGGAAPAHQACNVLPFSGAQMAAAPAWHAPAAQAWPAQHAAAQMPYSAAGDAATQQATTAQYAPATQQGAQAACAQQPQPSAQPATYGAFATASVPTDPATQQPQQYAAPPAADPYAWQPQQAMQQHQPHSHISPQPSMALQQQQQQASAAELHRQSSNAEHPMPAPQQQLPYSQPAQHHGASAQPYGAYAQPPGHLTAQGEAATNPAAAPAPAPPEDTWGLVQDAHAHAEDPLNVSLPQWHAEVPASDAASPAEHAGHSLLAAAPPPQADGEGHSGVAQAEACVEHPLHDSASGAHAALSAAASAEHAAPEAWAPGEGDVVWHSETPREQQGGGVEAATSGEARGAAETVAPDAPVAPAAQPAAQVLQAPQADAHAAGAAADADVVAPQGMAPGGSTVAPPAAAFAHARSDAPHTNTRKRSRPPGDGDNGSAGRRCTTPRAGSTGRGDVSHPPPAPRRRSMTAKSAAEMLIALRGDDPENGARGPTNGAGHHARGPRRGAPAATPEGPLSAEEAAAVHASIALHRDTLYTAFRKHAVKDEAPPALPSSAPTVTNHVLRIVCVTRIGDTCLRRDDSDVVTHLVVATTRGGPVLELPTFGLARGVREGVMLSTLLTCFIPTGHIKRTQLDPPTEVRTRARKDITAVRALTARHMKALLATAAPPPLTVSADDIAALRALNYAAELRSLVTLGRLLYAWQIDPALRPMLDVLVTSNRGAGGFALPPPAPPLPPPPAAAAAATAASSPAGSAANDVASNSGEAGPSTEAPAGAAGAAVAATAETGRPYAHDPRKMMLAQLIADQVTERKAGVATVRELANSVEAILCDGERHVTLNGRVDAMGAELAALQARHAELVKVQEAVEKELGAGAAGQPLHVVLSELAAATERMDDDVAYLLIGAKTMLSEKLLKDVFSDPL